MKTILVTGASGTVGSRVARVLRESGEARVLTTYRGDSPSADDEASARYFDLAEPRRSARALDGVDGVYLFLPPGLPAPGEAFATLLTQVLRGTGAHAPHVVFMSVQGADERAFLPHAKAETAIREWGGPQAFLRPSYFMQNLTEVFGADIRERHEIVVPAGDAPFLWVDADDIAAVAAAVLLDVGGPRGRAMDVTGPEHLTFGEAAEVLSDVVGHRIRYRPVGPLSYVWQRRDRAASWTQAGVEAAIHFAQRFTADAPVSGAVREVTGRAPRTLAEWALKVAPRLS